MGGIGRDVPEVSSRASTALAESCSSQEEPAALPQEERALPRALVTLTTETCPGVAAAAAAAEAEAEEA